MKSLFNKGLGTPAVETPIRLNIPLNNLTCSSIGSGSANGLGSPKIPHPDHEEADLYDFTLGPIYSVNSEQLAAEKEEDSDEEYDASSTLLQSSGEFSESPRRKSNVPGWECWQPKTPVVYTRRFSRAGEYSRPSPFSRADARRTRVLRPKGSEEVVALTPVSGVAPDSDFGGSNPTSLEDSSKSSVSTPDRRYDLVDLHDIGINLCQHANQVSLSGETHSTVVIKGLSTMANTVHRALEVLLRPKLDPRITDRVALLPHNDTPDLDQHWWRATQGEIDHDINAVRNISLLNKHWPELGKWPTISDQALHPCAECDPPSWISLFPVDDESDVGSCKCFDIRVIMYGDLSEPRKVKVLGIFGNLLMIDSAGVPNHKRKITNVRLDVPLLNPSKQHGLLMRTFYSALGLSCITDPVHRYGSVDVDLSHLLWFNLAAASPSNESWRRNLVAAVHDGRESVFWSSNVLQLAFSWHIYHLNVSAPSVTVSEGDWVMPKIINFAPIDYPIPNRSHDCQILDPICVNIVPHVDASLENSNPPLSVSSSETTVDPTAPAAPQCAPGIDPPVVAPDEKKAEEPVISYNESGPMSKTSIEDIEEDSDSDWLTEDSDDPFSEKEREKHEEIVAAMVEELNARTQVHEFKTVEGMDFDALPDKLGFRKGKLTDACMTTPGQHDWKSEIIIPPAYEGVKFTKFVATRVKVKMATGVRHGQIFGDSPFHYPSDTFNQIQAVAGRLGAEKPSQEAKIRIPKTETSEAFDLFPIKIKDIYIPPEFVIEGVDPERDIWDVEEDVIKNLIEHMGKAASRKRMLKLMTSVMGAKVSWSEASSKFTVFVKSDDKIAKHKARLIQFVPSGVWLKIMYRLDAVVKKIKVRWSWFDKRIKTRFVWASGMTQKNLSTHVTRAMHEWCNTLFICGDDNSDVNGAKDASMYDSTQRGYFAKLQQQFLKRLGFTPDEIVMMWEYHSGMRSGEGFAYKQGTLCLPSGAAWTLFVNTIGLIIFQTQLESVKYIMKKHGYKYTEEEAVQYASRLLGLSMTFDPAPNIDSRKYNGTEFLKGIMVGGKKRSYWVPTPSRLHKWTSKVFGDRVEDKLFTTEKQMKAHFKGVALGQGSFILDPLCQIWVDHWAKVGGEASKLSYEYQNIESNKFNPFDLDPEDRTNWIKLWEPIMEDRYNISPEEYKDMREQLLAHVGDFGVFSGKSWAKIWRRDYLGNAMG
jgi:hypothetical protein